MEFDLVDEMMWEDLVEFETLEEAGLENEDYDTVTAALQRYYWNDESGVEKSSYGIVTPALKTDYWNNTDTTDANDDYE